jgi:hypothetical protein
MNLEPNDEILLQAYMLGFDLELDGKALKIEFKHPLINRAVKLGSSDALIGDDVMSLNYQSNEEILKRIRSENTPT